MLNTNETSADLSIKQIIANDIQKHAEEMKISARQVIKSVANKTNVKLRTLERFFEPSKNFKPHVRTVVDIYSQIYNTESLAEIITKSPTIISEYIKNNHTQCNVGEAKVSDLSTNPAHQASLTASSVFNQIYLMTSGDYGTELSLISEKFGTHGLKQLDEMIKMGFVEIDENDRIKRKNKLTWDRTIRKNFVKTLISDVYNEENNDILDANYLGFATGDVSKEDYDLIREKIKINADEILSIINKSQPSYDNAIRIAFGKVLEKIEFKVEGDKLC